MQKLPPIFILIFSITVFIFNISAQEKQESTAKKETIKTDSKKKKTPKEPKFEDLIEGFTKIEGLFTLYQNVEDGKVYMEIRQDQFGETFLCNITRESGDASLFDSGALIGEFPFFIKRVGKNIQFIQRNVLFRASSDAAIHRAIEKDISHSLWGSTKVASQPHPERGSILIDPTDIFIKDFTMVGHMTSEAKIPYSFDKSNSYFSEIKSFPMNTEIEVTLHFKSSKPTPVFTLTDSRSMMHRYHYSLSSLPETDYKPRVADDRIGHFITMFQDYTSALDDTPYKRYITRWQIEKAEPKFKISKPKKPIVFWLENTIPVEYRDAVREGVLLWNKAFERIGFEDAIEVRQMPDDADWDPADVRYSTIRWIIQPGAGYAVGPFRANPFTGQIYDADIRISADYVRFFYREFGEFITPLSFADLFSNPLWPGSEQLGHMSLDVPPQHCYYAAGMMHQMAFGWNLLLARGLVSEDEEDLKKFIHDGIVDLVVHEVGHTLGLRHNFKASSTIPIDKLADPNFTREKGISGSVMDYNPVNLLPKDKPQGNYFQTTLGAYDYWAIEYAYKPLDPDSKQSEKEMLEEIAQRVADPRLQYGTDEDAFGFSSRGIDPTINLYDLGDDPIAYMDLRTNLAQELWKSIPEKFEKKGEKYQKFRKVFAQALTEYAIASNIIPKFVGGIYYHRDHIGDPHGRPPFKVVPAEKQREALHLVCKKFFSPDAFQFSPDLLNKLAPERFWDFEGTVFRMFRIDYPIHGIVQLIQSSALFRLFDPLVLQRIQDNELRFEKKSEAFTMPELFQTVREAIWQELKEGKNINSFRRELQRNHLYILGRIVAYSPRSLPNDAITLARADLEAIKDQINHALSSKNLDTYTRAHLKETRAKIESILKAQIQKFF